MSTITANPNLWSQYLGEVFKWRKHRMFVLLVAAPFFLALVITCGVLLTANRGSMGDIDNLYFGDFGVPTYDLGRGGAFSFIASIFSGGFFGLYNIAILVACANCVFNEFNWKTIKMIASRQPSRTTIILAKVLFVLTLIIVCYIALILSWILVSLFFKLYYTGVLTMTANDFDALSKGRAHFALRFLGTFVWALLIMAVAYRTKSIVGAFLIYFVYSAVESFMSTFGATVINSPQYFQNAAGLSRTLAEAAASLYPAWLTTHLNRVTMVEANPTIVATLPPDISWLVICIYIGAFFALAMLIFGNRDIKE
jgi:ABC-type transport system involved in multi-copper enzyme maturation permease subunit